MPWCFLLNLLTALYRFEIDGVQRIFLVATKDIPGGAWLTLNYAQEPICLLTVEGSLPACLCGRRDCSGFIGATARQNAWKKALFAQRVKAERLEEAKKKVAQLDAVIFADAQRRAAQPKRHGRSDDAPRCADRAGNVCLTERSSSQTRCRT
jgi:hypothetical protein